MSQSHTNLSMSYHIMGFTKDPDKSFLTRKSLGIVMQVPYQLLNGAIGGASQAMRGPLRP